jgi:aminopeptidase-like protein
VLDKEKINYIKYSFLDRGSDERQFCSPLVDLPFCSITRSKYGTYPEYHTSGDDMKLISADALQASIEYYMNLIDEFEANRVFKPLVLGEPMFLKHSLRDKVGGKDLNELHTIISNIVAFSDSTRDITEIAKLLSLSIQVLSAHCDVLSKKGILTQL